MTNGENPTDRLSLKFWAIEHGWRTFAVSSVEMKYQLEQGQELNEALRQLAWRGAHINLDFAFHYYYEQGVLYIYQDPTILPTCLEEHNANSHYSAIREVQGRNQGNGRLVDHLGNRTLEA